MLCFFILFIFFASVTLSCSKFFCSSFCVTFLCPCPLFTIAYLYLCSALIVHHRYLYYLTLFIIPFIVSIIYYFSLIKCLVAVIVPLLVFPLTCLSECTILMNPF